MDNNKKFDAVQMMREIREKLSIKYWKHPDVLKKEMEAIRQKYHLQITTPKPQLCSIAHPGQQFPQCVD